MLHTRSRVTPILWSLLGLIACLTVLAVTIHPPANRETRWYEKTVLTILSPFQRTVNFVTDSVKSIVGGYVFLVGVASENEELRAVNRHLAYRTMLLEETESENERLRRLLSLQKTKHWETVAAEVIAFNPRSEFRLMTINRGSRHGLKQRMPVIASEGLVGQVYRVAPSTSQILLLTDPTSAVDAKVETGGARGLLVGKILTTQWNRSFFLTSLEYVDRVAPVANGVQIVTTGLDGIFPRGIPIGHVSQVKVDSQGIFKEAQVVPSVDPMSLEEVLVILNVKS